MNATMTEQPLALAAPAEQQPAALPVARTSALSLAMDVGSMQALMELANVMATSRITIPKHLQGNPGDCLAIAMQAAQWGMNAFVVAQKTHVVNGTLGYEAQLVNAVVQASGLIEPEGFSYEYRGAGNAIECRVGARKRGQQEITWGEWLRLDTVTTKNSPLWKTNPKQQLGYLQVKNWARAYAPGAVLGIYTPDELEQSPVRAPRAMGAAQQADAAPELPLGLLEAAEHAASEGVAAYQQFWRDTGPANRKHLADHHPRLKQAAIDADAARTVDMPQAGGEPALDVAAMLQRIEACTDVSILMLIGDDVATLPAGPEREQLEAAIAKRGDELEG